MSVFINAFLNTLPRPGLPIVQPLSPPPVPDRTASHTDNVTPAHELLYLVGRKPYVSNPTESLQDYSSPESLGVREVMGIMDTSTSDDTMSMYSVASRTSSIGRPGSGSLHRSLAKTASDALSRMSADSDGGTSRQFVRTKSPGLAVAQSATSSEASDLFSEPDLEVRKHTALRSTKSLPIQYMENGEMESGLVEIKEGEELASPRNSQEVPLLELPTSPTKVTSASSRKKRLASKRVPPGKASTRKGFSCKYTYIQKSSLLCLDLFLSNFLSIVCSIILRGMCLAVKLIFNERFSPD